MVEEESELKFQVLRTDYPMEVHAVGCSHNSRKRLPLDWTIEGETVEAAVAAAAAELNSQFDNEYPVDQLFRILPCCQGGR
jgi:hypothetical protein